MNLLCHILVQLFWNKTPDTLKHNKNLNTIKHNLKKYFLNELKKL